MMGLSWRSGRKRPTPASAPATAESNGGADDRAPIISYQRRLHAHRRPLAVLVTRKRPASRANSLSAATSDDLVSEIAGDPLGAHRSSSRYAGQIHQVYRRRKISPGSSGTTPDSGRTAQERISADRRRLFL